MSLRVDHLSCAYGRLEVLQDLKLGFQVIRNDFIASVPEGLLRRHPPHHESASAPFGLCLHEPVLVHTARQPG